MQCSVISLPNWRVKASTSFIMRAHLWMTTKSKPVIPDATVVTEGYSLRTPGSPWLLSSHISNKKSVLQRYRLRWEITQRPYAVSPTKEWQYTSYDRFDCELNQTGQSRGPFSVNSSSHSLVCNNLTVVTFDSTLSSGWSRIYPIPSVNQSVFKKTDLSLSYRARTGEEVIPFLHLFNSLTRSGVYSTWRISFLWWRRWIARSGLRLISNQGEKPE